MTVTSSASFAVAVPLTAVALSRVTLRVSGESCRISSAAVTVKSKSVPTNASVYVSVVPSKLTPSVASAAA